MKLNLFLALILPIAIYAQDSNTGSNVGSLPNTFSSGSSNINPFTNEARRFNDWAISVGGGAAFMVHSDLTSFHDGDINWGWNAYASLDKQINHTFGINLQYQMGQTNQRGQLPGAAGLKAGVAEGFTKFHQVSVLGDVNFSNLLRRVDNYSPYRWALHGYAGIGVQGFNTQLRDNNLLLNQPNRPDMRIEQDFAISSIFFQGGLGLKYKVSKLVDLELRTMYIISGDEEFDGGGDYRETAYPEINYNLINDTYSDNMWTVNLGLSFKLGKHLSHLAWHDPLQEVYYKTNLLENQTLEKEVCEKGDLDNDGVCDDWDRQLDTPAGARVDGAGVALDMDLDGVIDLYDKCVTVPGPAENNGCPTTPVAKNLAPNSIDEINKNFEGIEFELNSDKIRSTSNDKLNQAAEIIKTLNANDKFLVIGATDTRVSEEYNKKLSQKRANAVVAYLVNKGVSSSMLEAEGRGKSDLKYPECDPATKCPEWKNEANRRVYFQQK